MADPDRILARVVSPPPVRRTPTPPVVGAAPPREPLLELQRTHGNRFVSRMLARADNGAAELSPEVEEEIERARGGGSPLGPEVRAKMESALGGDLSGVRLHTGGRADSLSRGLDARAFTTGRDVFFRAGAYQPETNTGRELLAHELVHVLQQRDEPVQAKLELGPVDDEYEREADDLAREVVQRWHDAPATTVRRACADCSDKTTCAACREVSSPVQRQVDSGSTAAAPGTAPPRRIKAWLNAFIPMATIPDPTAIIASDCFAGDNRGFSNAIHASSRTHQEIEFDVATLTRTIDWRHVGTSHRVDCTTGAVKNSATAPTTQLTNGPVTRVGSNVVIRFAIAATNPLVFGAPAIDADMLVHVDPVRRTASTTGSHDGFPAYELYVTADGGAGVAVHTYHPTTAGKTPEALFPPMDESGAGGPVGF